MGVVTGRGPGAGGVLSALRADPRVAVEFAVQVVEDLPSGAAGLDVVVLDVAALDGHEVRSGISVLGDFGIGVVACADPRHRRPLRVAARCGAAVVPTPGRHGGEVAAAVRRAACAAGRR